LIPDASETQFPSLGYYFDFPVNGIKSIGNLLMTNPVSFLILKIGSIESGRQPLKKSNKPISLPFSASPFNMISFFFFESHDYSIKTILNPFQCSTR